MALTADKVAGVRALPIDRADFAALARHHNNANVVCLSGRFVDLDVNEGIVKTFLETGFDGGRHALRVDKIMFWVLLLLIIYLVEILVAVIQAYVFTLLSAVYVQLVEQDE